MNFWVLSPPDTGSKLASWDKSVVLEGPVLCPVNPNHQRDGKRQSDLIVQLPPFTATPDFIWTWYSECLITGRVLRLFQRSKLSGFEGRRAYGTASKSDAPLSLFELIILGWGGVASPSSGIRLIEDCRSCQLKIYSGFDNPARIIDESSWDGSDFFMVWPLPRIIFLSDKAAQVIRDNRLTGLSIKAAADLQSNLLNELSPGRLSHWMPENRARKLGDALDIY
jgi:hypothetical protein